TALLLCAIFLCMPVRTAASHAHRSSNAALTPQASPLTENPQVRTALDWLQSHLAETGDTQSRITEIPAPPFQESARAQAMKALLESAGLSAQIDKIGNVIATLSGANTKSASNEYVVLSAHLDTVFPPGTDTKVRRESNRFLAPGISDNGTGLAALIAIAR